MTIRKGEHIQAEVNGPVQSGALLFKKIIGVLFYAFAFIFAFILIKTELRKYFVFGGEASSANTFLFWLSLGATLFFGWAGSKVWPRQRDNDPDSKDS